MYRISTSNEAIRVEGNFPHTIVCGSGNQIHWIGGHSERSTAYVDPPSSVLVALAASDRGGRWKLLMC